MKRISLIKLGLIVLVGCILIGNVYILAVQAKEIDGKFYILTYELTDGVVGDELTAAKVAECVLFSLYPRSIHTGGPQVKLTEDEIWIVQSRLTDGSVLAIEIRRLNGEILRAYKTKTSSNGESIITQVIPKYGFVSEQKAKELAEIYGCPIYGEDIITQRPFSAKLTEDKVWILDGWLPENIVGGTLHIEICKENGKVLDIFHGK